MPAHSALILVNMCASGESAENWLSGTRRIPESSSAAVVASASQLLCYLAARAAVNALHCALFHSLFLFLSARSSLRVYYFFPPPWQCEKKTRTHLFCQEQRASCRHRRQRRCCFICAPVSFRIFRLPSQGQKAWSPKYL